MLVRIVLAQMATRERWLGKTALGSESVWQHLATCQILTAKLVRIVLAQMATREH